MNALMFAALYYGVMGNVGAARVYTFFIWFEFIGFCVIYSARNTPEMQKIKNLGRAVYPQLDGFLDIVAVGVMLYFGWRITAIALLLTAGFKSSFYDDVYI